VTGETVTAALMNTHISQNLIQLSTWVSYTPVVTQSGTVTKTVTYAKHISAGNLVIVQAYLVITGAGTNNNTITVSLPTTAAHSNAIQVGVGRVTDFGTQSYPCIMQHNTTTTVAFLRCDVLSPGGLVGVDPQFALANTDILQFSITYEAA
jgi:hypothetical protein